MKFFTFKIILNNSTCSKCDIIMSLHISGLTRTTTSKKSLPRNPSQLSNVVNASEATDRHDSACGDSRPPSRSINLHDSENDDCVFGPFSPNLRFSLNEMKLYERLESPQQESMLNFCESIKIRTCEIIRLFETVLHARKRFGFDCGVDEDEFAEQRTPDYIIYIYTCENLFRLCKQSNPDLTLESCY